MYTNKQINNFYDIPLSTLSDWKSASAENWRNKLYKVLSSQGLFQSKRDRHYYFEMIMKDDNFLNSPSARAIALNSLLSAILWDIDFSIIDEIVNDETFTNQDYLDFLKGDVDCAIARFIRLRA